MNHDLGDLESLIPKVCTLGSTFMMGLKALLLGQMFVLHDRDSESIPGQSSAPECAGGLVHNRLRV